MTEILPHQSERKQERLCHQLAAGSFETSLLPAYHSVKNIQLTTKNNFI